MNLFKVFGIVAGQGCRPASSMCGYHHVHGADGGLLLFQCRTDRHIILLGDLLALHLHYNIPHSLGRNNGLFNLDSYGLGKAASGKT